ncbi:hypothetical protein SSX86_005327 [Deinandra increscens subsp. villosa]|uniref:Uncharacterized protein n=1 Tax=Deinandra increscens subsp. villosa TaxID=3103831 RepID=A0AAP0H9Y1_9ASTR
MACFVSSFCPFTGFTSPKTLIKDIQTRKPDSCRLHLSSSTFLNGISFLARGEELLSMKLYHNPVVAVLVDCKVFSSPRVISGFWVGPDIDDGWGFVEAFVNQMKTDSTLNSLTPDSIDFTSRDSLDAKSKLLTGFLARGEELLSMKLYHSPVVAVLVDYKVSCSPRVISGFWVGPDIDDGWGFV